MKYKIEITDSAEKSLKKLPKRDRLRIEDEIDTLAYDPRPSGCKKLAGRNPVRYRIRTGNYRIVYAIKDSKLLIIIVDVGHRKDIYR